MNTSKAEEEDPEDGENSRTGIRTRGTLRRQKNNSSIPSPSRSPSPQIPKIRKLGHATQSLSVGSGSGSKPADDPNSESLLGSEGVPLLDATKLHPLSFSQESADPVAAGGTCAMTPARSVPDMEIHKSRLSYLPYTKLDSVTQKYPRQLSSHTTSFASEGSQVNIFLLQNSFSNLSKLHFVVLFQESLYYSEKYPVPLQIKSLSPSPLARHRIHPPCSRPRSKSGSSSAIMPATPPAHQIPLITRTGPNCPGGQGGQLITIIRQRSHPEQGSKTSAQNDINCEKCTRCPSWAGFNSGGTCSPQAQLSIPQYRVRGGSVHLTPKRYSSVSSSEEFASIAADTMKINGALKQFKQVCV